MWFKQRNWVWKINIFGKHIKARAGKRNPFDYERVKKMAQELIKKQRLEAKTNKNNSYQF